MSFVNLRELRDEGGSVGLYIELKSREKAVLRALRDDGALAHALGHVVAAAAAFSPVPPFRDA